MGNANLSKIVSFGVNFKSVYFFANDSVVKYESLIVGLFSSMVSAKFQIFIEYILKQN